MDGDEIKAPYTVNDVTSDPDKIGGLVPKRIVEADGDNRPSSTNKNIDENAVL
jgi:hypothetical protein